LDDLSLKKEKYRYQMKNPPIKVSHFISSATINKTYEVFVGERNNQIYKNADTPTHHQINTRVNKQVMKHSNENTNDLR